MQYYCLLKGAKAEVVKHLIAKGASTSCRDNAGDTLLYSAVLGNNIEVIKYLVEQKLDVNEVIKRLSFTPLYCAVERCSLDVIKLLVESGAEVNKKIATGDSPIAMAACLGDVEKIQYLFNKGADIKVVNNDGFTILHEVFSSGSIEAISLVLSLDHSFDLAVKEKNGKTPLHSLLEAKKITAEQKIKVIEKFIDKLDVSVLNNSDKDVNAYVKEHCQEALQYLTISDNNDLGDPNELGVIGDI